MNQKKAKAIRRAMRAELAKGSGERWVAHPRFYINVRNQPMLKYVFQYITDGGKKIVKYGKKIYTLTGILPRKQS